MIDISSNVSFKDQIKGKILKDIVEGKIKAGRKLSSVPELAKKMQVSTRPIQDAYRELKTDGIIISRRKRGTVLSNDAIDIVKNTKDGFFNDKGNRHVLNAGKKTNEKKALIGLVIPTINTSLHPVMIKKAEEVAYKKGYGSILCNYDDDIKKLKSYFNMLSEKKVEGIIISPFSIDITSVVKKINIPIVFVADRPSTIQTDFVTVNNNRAAHVALRHLLDMGHKNIGFISGPKEDFVSKQRMESFIRAAKEIGKGYIRYKIFHGNYHEDGGYKATIELINKFDNMTSVFSINSLSTIGLLRAFKEKGIKIPEDMSVITFDEMLYPCDTRITTVAQPRELLGEKAIEVLIHRIKNKTKNSYKEVILEPYLIYGDSVKKLTKERE